MYVDPRPIRHGATLLAKGLVSERSVAVVTQSDALAWGKFRPVRYRMSWVALGDLTRLATFLWLLAEREEAFLVSGQKQLIYQLGGEEGFWDFVSVGLRQGELQSAAKDAGLSLKNLKVENA